MREARPRPGATSDAEAPQSADAGDADAGAGTPQQAARAQRAHKRRDAAGDAEAVAFNERHAAEVAEFNQLTQNGCLGEDGKLDPAAVKDWQREHNVAPDGKVGPKTVAAAKGQTEQDGDKIDKPDATGKSKAKDGPLDEILSWLDLGTVEKVLRDLKTFAMRPPSAAKDGNAAQPDQNSPKEDQSGLASQLAVDHFVAATEKLKPHWERLKPAQRGEALLKAANEQLVAAGVDAVDTQLSTEVGGQIAGKFRSKLWRILLNKELFSKPRLRWEDAPQMATTVFHEARHAEQHYRMAQALAGQPNQTNAAQIAKSINIPVEIAESAMKKPFAGDAAAFGQKMFDDKYGAQAAHYTQVHDEVEEQMKVYTEVVTRLQHAKTPEEKEAAQEELQRIKAPVMNAYAAYRALATEADAFHVEDEATAAFAAKK